MVRSLHGSPVSEGGSPLPEPSPRSKGKRKGKGTKRKASSKPSEGVKRPPKKQKEASPSPITIKRSVAPPPWASIPSAGPSTVPAQPLRQRRSEAAPPAKPKVVSEKEESSEEESSEEESSEEESSEEESSEEEESDQDPDITMQDYSPPRIQTPDPLDIVSQLQPLSPLPTDVSLDLQGSSRTTGGFARGKAAGNVPNAADFSDIQEFSTIIPIPSYIYFYFTSEDPAGMALTDIKVSYKASMAKRSSLQDVIQRIRIQYPEVDGMCFSLTS
jgi:hypothetical protein